MTQLNAGEAVPTGASTDVLTLAATLHTIPAAFLFPGAGQHKPPDAHHDTDTVALTYEPTRCHKRNMHAVLREAFRSHRPSSLQA